MNFSGWQKTNIKIIAEINLGIALENAEKLVIIRTCQNSIMLCLKETPFWPSTNNFKALVYFYICFIPSSEGMMLLKTFKTIKKIYLFS